MDFSVDSRTLVKPHCVHFVVTDGEKREAKMALACRNFHPGTFVRELSCGNFRAGTFMPEVSCRKFCALNFNVRSYEVSIMLEHFLACIFCELQIGCILYIAKELRR